LLKLLTPVASYCRCYKDIVIVSVLDFSVEAELRKLQIGDIIVFYLSQHGTSLKAHLANYKHSIVEEGSHYLEISRRASR
jgi:hypothetical protein